MESSFKKGVCTSNTKPQCQTGYFNGKTCQESDDPICFEGAKLVGDSCVLSPMCMFGESSSVDPKTGSEQCCPTGMNWDSTKKVCSSPSTSAASCPSDSIFKDKECVLTPEDASCPGGFTYNGKSCIYNSSPLCSPGSVLSNGTCILNETPVCNIGTFNGADCVISQQPTCPGKNTISGDNCVSTTQPICPPNMVINGKDCMFTAPPICPSGSTATGNSCTTVSSPSCAVGTFKDGFCIADQLPSVSNTLPYQKFLD